MIKFTFLIAFFGVITIFGIFLLMFGMAASHGHFQFRPHMTEDWIIFGTPLVGVIGIILVAIAALRNRDK